MTGYQVGEAAEQEAWRLFLDAWWARFGPTPVAVRDLLELPEAVPLVRRHSAPGIQRHLLGRMLGANPLANGHHILRASWAVTGKRKKGNFYRPATWALTESISEPTGTADEETAT